MKKRTKKKEHIIGSKTHSVLGIQATKDEHQ